MVRRAEVSDARTVSLASVDLTIFVDNDFISYIKTKALANRPLLEGDVQTLFTLGHPIAFRVVRTEPKGFVRICKETILNVQAKPNGHNFYEQDVRS